MWYTAPEMHANLSYDHAVPGPHVCISTGLPACCLVSRKRRRQDGKKKKNFREDVFWEQARVCTGNYTM